MNPGCSPSYLFRSVSVALRSMILVGWCWIWTMSIANGQEQHPPGYWLQHFTDENGLPQNSVKAIAQDRNGFVWLTTEAGLVRFDGHRFITFDRSLVPITSNRIRGFVPAVTRDAKNERHEFYALSEKNEYIGILRNGLVSADTAFYNNYKKHNPFARNETRHNSILPSLPVQLQIDPFAEHYFAASDSGKYYIWRKDQVTCFQYGKPVFATKGPFRNLILIGQKPYGTDNQGHFRTIGVSSREVSIEGDITLNSHFPEQKDRLRLFWNNISRQAFLYLNDCLYLLKPSPTGNLTTRLILKGFDFDNRNIVTAYFDETGGFLFLGSTTMGLFAFKKEGFQTQKLNADSADNVYYAQIPVRGRSVLTSQGYLLGTNPDGSGSTAKRVSAFMERFGYKFTMAQNRDSTFWFGIGLDLYKLDRMGQKILAYVKLPDRAKSLYIEPAGRLWIGCENRVLYTLDETGGRYRPRRMFTLHVDGVAIMDREDAETLFLGTENGLYRLNTRTGVFQTIRAFKNITVRSFHTTRDGTWITTYGNGIYLLKKNKLVKFPLDHDRFLATAHCIVEDKKGFFWITTNRGLFQVAKKQFLDYASNRRNLVYYLYYDKRNGFETNEFNGGCQPCALALADGTVSLPSMDGLVWYKPETIIPNLPDKGIFINSIQEDGKELDVADRLEISRDFDQLRFMVTTPYLGNIRNIEMHYSLSGTGRPEKWTPVNADFIVPIPKLRFGDYVLKIRKVNGFGSNDYTYKTVYLHIPRAWYEMWWFQSLMVVAMAGLFFLSVKWRTTQLVKKEREANLIRHYRVISQIIAAVNHDIQTPLHYMGYSLKQINAYLHKQSNGDSFITRMSDETLNTSQRLSTLTKNFLDYIKLQSKTESARREMNTVLVAGLVSTISELFAATATFRGVTLQNRVDPELAIQSDPNLLSIILHNLIDNALKVSQSEVTVTAGDEDGRPLITIHDDGPGMPVDQVGWLNKNYKSYEDWLRASQQPDQKGIGLVIVKDLCVLLGISITVIVRDQSGTSIVLTLNGNEK